MKRQLLGFAILSIILFNECKIICPPKPPPEKRISYCDTVQRVLNRISNECTPSISNIDPEMQVFPVKLEDMDYYQIEFNEIPLFREYQVLLDEITFDFNIDANNLNCSKAGTKVICLINQSVLAQECQKRHYEDADNGFDCIFMHRWSIRVRGKVCDNIFGPFSNSLNNVSLQCKK